MAAPRLKLSELRGFPETFEENGKIKIVEFLDASNEIVALMEQFGTLFTPVVSDMRGNTSQLFELYQKEGANLEYIEDMILTTTNPSAKSWLLWLKRALELVERFFFYILNDQKIIEQKSDSLQPMIAKAYDEVLRPYHGFFLQQTFKMLNRFIPGRTTLLGSNEHFEGNVQHLNILMPKMRMHVDKIDRFLKENGLDDTSKV